MRPKSMATVVVVLPGTALVSSTARECVVIGASVVSGVISEMASTNVVLPAAKPPATTIFSGRTPRGAGRASPWGAANGSKSLEVIEQPLEGVEVGPGVVDVRLGDGHQAGGHQVGDDDPGDAEVHAEV